MVGVKVPLYEPVMVAVGVEAPLPPTSYATPEPTQPVAVELGGLKVILLKLLPPLNVIPLVL